MDRYYHSYQRLAVLGTLVLALASMQVAAALSPVRVSLAKHATLTQAGQTAELAVKVACAPGYEVLEAFVYITQDEHTSQFRGLPVVCDKHPHRLTVSVL